jgi:type IV pilus assembly protein PilC
MTKKAKNFTFTEISPDETFNLDQKNKSKDVEAKEAQVKIDNLASGKGADEEVLRLDIDAVDLIKLEKIATASQEKVTKSKSAYLLAYQKLNSSFSFGHFVPIREKQTFYELISVMLESGIPILKAIKVYADQTTHAYFKKVCQAIAYQLEKGQKFSEALGEYRNVFTESEQGVIEASEATGRLADSLKRLGVEVEKAATLKAKLKGALIYPAVVLVFVLITLFVLLRFVIPQISQLFLDTGLELPLLTRVVIAASQFLVNNGFLVLLLVFGFVLANLGLYKVRKVRYYYHYFFLHLPTFGQFQKDYAQASFARSLANLIASGVGIVASIEITAKTIGNLVYQDRIKLLAKDVSNGIGIGDSLEHSPYFSDMLVSMITVGEQTAQIDTIAAKLANYYTEKVNNSAENLTKLLQPLIIGVVGGIVGLIVLAIMLPLSQIIGNIGSL